MVEAPVSISVERKLPVWALGLANMPTGFVYGFISTAFGVLLTARGVSVGRVLDISYVAFSPCWWAWCLCPVLDVRFTKRGYAWFFAALAAGLLGVTVLLLDHLFWFKIALTAACTAAVFFSSAVGGMMPDMVGEAEYDRISAWFNVANLGAAGVFSWASVVLVRALPLPLAAGLLACLVFAPALLLLGFPAPPQPAGTLRANFAAMGRDLRRIVRQGRVWIGLALFLSPASCFALTNAFSSLGSDFHTPERMNTLLNGPGVALVCSVGSLLAAPLLRHWQRRTVYLLSGFAAATCAIAGVWLPHTVMMFAVVLLLYNMAQGFNYTSFYALIYEIVGPRNALAATTVAVLNAAGNFPITMMTKLEGRVYDRHGLGLMFWTDAASSIGAALLLLLVVLPLLDRRVRREQAMPVL